LFLNSGIASQTHPNSPVYKDYKPADSSSIFRKVDDSFQLWQSYFLIKEANSGNPLAQHELGIRYLTGRGYPPDSAKSYYWIKKAADKELPPANYNLALLLNNGWGTEWNPYEAYRRFSSAAKDSMPEALFAIGLLNTDNLVVPRNYKKAYDYIKASADMGFKPAREILIEFQKLGYGSKSAFEADEANAALNYEEETSGITFFEIETDSSRIDDLTLLRDLIKEEGDHFSKNLGIITLSNTTLKADSTIMVIIKAAAEAGSPEALTLLGRCYEKGIGVKKDRVRAAVEYIRALRLDSRKGSLLIWGLLEDNSFLDELNSRLKANDLHTQFVWATLTALQLSNQLNDKDAFDLLVKAARQSYIPAIIELGMCYYSGIFVEQNRVTADSIWKSAAEMGSKEAEVRIAISNLQDENNSHAPGKDLQRLSLASDQGSLIAVVALAYCYLNGIGVEKNKAEAVELYRKAAQRGSRGAQNALRRIYDEIRPEENEFLVLD